MDDKSTMVIGFASVWGPLLGRDWLVGIVLGGLFGYTFYMYLLTRKKS